VILKPPLPMHHAQLVLMPVMLPPAGGPCHVSCCQKMPGLFCRFSYCALSCCRLLGQLNALDVKAAVSYVASCRNIDGGFGCTPGGALHPSCCFVTVRHRLLVKRLGPSDTCMIAVALICMGLIAFLGHQQCSEDPKFSAPTAGITL